MRTTAHAITEQLTVLGADLMFGVPGESYLAVLDALHDTSAIRFITCRQEGGAAFAAEAAGKLTGRPGVVMVTRGPGATNAAIGIHTAQQDETPLLIFVGQVPRHQRGRDAFQELDLAAVFGSMCKWVHELDDAQRAPDVVARAWSLTTSGRPGPVMIGLPEDMLTEQCDAAVVAPGPSPASSVSAGTVGAIRALLDAAERPLVIVGGSRWSDAASDQLPRSFAGVPVVTAFRRQDLVDHRLASFAGSLGIGADPALLARVHAADVVVCIGDRLDDSTTNGFTLLDTSGQRAALVHVHPDPNELGRVFTPRLSVAAAPEAFLDALGIVPTQQRWADWLAHARTGYVAWRNTEGLLDDVVRGLRLMLPDDAIVTNGAGNFTRPVQRSFAFGRPGRHLAPISGAMGYGLPAAMAAKVVHPDRVVVCVAGDGDLLMTSQELATIARLGLGVVVLVVDNSSYGTIRTHQERRYPGRPFATALTNPDFVEFAHSFGMRAERTTTAAETIDALQRGVASGVASLVHLVTD